MKKPELFSLTKVKLLKGGGIEVSFRDQKTDKGITDTMDFNVKNTINPHPDLVNAIDKMKPYLSKCYHMDTVVELSKSKGLGVKDEDAFKQVSKLIENAHKEVMKKIDITGIAISGMVEDDKDKRSVIITGTQLMENNSKTALNSPRIKLNNDTFKFEADVQELVNEIADECYMYLFEGKKAQLDMFSEPQLSEDFKKGDIGKDAKEPKKGPGRPKKADKEAA